MKKQFLFILIFIFIIFFACSDYTNGDEVRFISYKKMLSDYEYFWGFIYKGYPFSEVCERNGADLKKMKIKNYESLSGLASENAYLAFYDRLCRQITIGKSIGHLYAVDKYDYKYVFKTSMIGGPFITKILLIDGFYSKLIGGRSSTEIEKNIFYCDFFNDEFPCYSCDIYTGFLKRIIEPGKIAYVKLDSFLIVSREIELQYLRDLKDFFIETADYKHIIIDIQNNGGGYIENYEAIISPNIKENLTIVSYGLYNENKYTNPYLEMFFKGYRDIKKIEKHEVPNIENCGTVKNDKAYKLEDMIEPSYILDYKPCEDKKFWLLVSGDVYSAADRFTYVCKKTGFATVIGTNTKGAGNNGLWPMYIVLPNSGLLIKFDFIYGLTDDGYCTDEFGTAPDIYNLPGKDALETCLEEIRKLGEKTN